MQACCRHIEQVDLGFAAKYPPAIKADELLNAHVAFLHALLVAP